MVNGFIYKRLSTIDIAIIDQMNVEFRTNIIDKQYALRFLENQSNLWYVALDHHRIVSFLYGFILDRLDGKPMAYIHEIGTIKPYQRNNIAYTLFQTMKADLFNQGITKIFLMTQTKNVAACNLYQKLGGEIMTDEDYGVVDCGFVFKQKQ